VRLLAYHQERKAAVSPHPEVERHPAQDGNHRVDDFRGEPCHLNDGDRLSAGRNSEQRLQQVGHRVFDRPAGKHELVAGVLRHRLDARLEAAEFWAVVLSVQLSELLVDGRKHVGHPVGNRGIHRVAAIVAFAAQERTGAFLPLPVAGLGEGNEVGKRIDLLLDARPPPIDHVGDLLEVEEPERQVQIAWADNGGLVGEGLMVLVVRVDQKNADGSVRLQELAQKQRNGAGLSATGRAEDSKMLLQEVLHPSVASMLGSWLSRPMTIVCSPP
jgi:hypothetical protein